MLRTFPNAQFTTGIQPAGGGPQADATPLQPGFNSMLNAINLGDAVQLPDAIAGTVVIGFVELVLDNFILVYAKDGTSDSINQAPNEATFFFPPAPNSFWFL